MQYGYKAFKSWQNVTYGSAGKNAADAAAASTDETGIIQSMGEAGFQFRQQALSQGLTGVAADRFVKERLADASVGVVQAHIGRGDWDGAERWLGVFSSAHGGGGGGGTVQLPADIAGMADKEAQGIDPTLVKAVISTESGGRINLTSKAGAYGPMQLMPGTAKQLGVDAKDPASNIKGGVTCLKQLLQKYNDPKLALMACNWGPGNVDAYLKTGKGMNGQPVPAETKNYVPKVMKAMGQGGSADSAMSTPGGGAAWLPPDKAASLKLQIQRGRERDETKAKAEQARAQAEARIRLRYDYEDDIAALSDGKEVKRDYKKEDFIAVGDSPEEAQRKVEQFKSAQEYSAVVNKLHGLSTEEQVRMLKDMEPKAGEDGYAVKASAYQNAMRAFDADQKARAKDPTGYVINVDPQVKQSFQDMVSNVTSENVEKYALARESALKARGMREDGGLLPSVTVNAFADSINKSDNPGGVMKQLQDAFGPKYFGALEAQLVGDAKIPTETMLIMDMPPSAGELLRDANRDKDFSKKAENLLNVRNATKTDLDNTVRENLDDFLQTLMAGGDSSLAYDILEATKKLTLQYMMRLGYGMEQAAAKAANDVALDRYHIVEINERKARVPKAYDVDPVETGMRGVLRDVASHPEELDSAAHANMKKEDVNRMYASSVEQFGHWVTNEDESGVILFVHDRPITRGGKFITRTWDELKERGTQKPSAMKAADVQALMEE